MPEFTIASARSAAQAGELATWVADFLASDGSDNADLGEQLIAQYPIWSGPVELPLDQLRRLAGPPDQPTLEELDDDDLDSVEAMQESIGDGWRPPPFVVTWKQDHLALEDGNHRAEALRRAGHDGYWCVVGFADEQSRADHARQW